MNWTLRTLRIVVPFYVNKMAAEAFPPCSKVRLGPFASTSIIRDCPTWGKVSVDEELRGYVKNVKTIKARRV